MTVMSFASEMGRPDKTLAYWNDVMRDVFLAPWELSPACPDTFEMTMDAVAIDDMHLSRATLSQAKIVNKPEPAGRRQELIYYLQVATTEQHVVWEEGESRLLPGEIMLLNSSRRCRSVTDGPYSTIALSVPGDILRQYLPDPEEAVGRPIPGADGLSRAASHLLRSLWELSDAGVLPELGGKLSRNLLELFAISWSASRGAAQPGTPASRARSAQIRKFADQHIRDPDLSVDFIASSLGVSTRYIQMIFRAEGESLWSYVRRKRLEGCRADLLDPLWRDRSITTIAFDWGFNSTTHFTRLFREHFGVAPSCLRKTVRAAGAADPGVRPLPL